MLDRHGLLELGKLPAAIALRALGNSLPTFVDARALTDAVIAHLGDAACVEDERGPQRWVYRRDPDDDRWLLWPPLVDEQGWGPIGDVPEPPRDRIVPKGPDMHAGKLVLRCGDARLSIAFDAVGMRIGFEDVGGDSFVLFHQRHERPFVIDSTARPPTPSVYPLLLRGDLDPAGHPVETLATWIVEAIVEAASVPATTVRLWTPATLPLGSQATLLRIRRSVAVALWHGEFADDARWLAVDGYCGRAWCAAPDREAATTGLHAALWRVKPALLGGPGGESLAFAFGHDAPAPSPDDPEYAPDDAPIPLPIAPRTAAKPNPDDDQNDDDDDDDDDGDDRPDGNTGPRVVFSKEISVSFGPFVSAHPWPPADPEHLPAALLELPPRPRVPAPLAAAGFTPVAIVGERGELGWMFRRMTETIAVLVGAHVADLVDPGTLDADLDAAEATWKADWGGIDGFPVEDAFPPRRALRGVGRDAPARPRPRGLQRARRGAPGGPRRARRPLAHRPVPRAVAPQRRSAVAPQRAAPQLGPMTDVISSAADYPDAARKMSRTATRTSGKCRGVMTSSTRRVASCA